MQSASSKPIQGKDKSGTGSKGKAGQSEKQTSRTRNTSGGESGGSGGRTLIFCDGKNVTPKPLVPSNPNKDASKAGDGADEQGGSGAAAKTASGELGAVGAGVGGDGGPSLGGEEGARVAEPAPPPVMPTLEKGKAQKPAGLTRDELERNIDIVLAETETDTLLTFASLCVALDNMHPQTGATAINAKNKAYDELVSSKAESDQYRDWHAQTLNNPHKSKEVLAAPPSQESVEVNANRWDIYDTFATDPVPKHVQIQNACERESAATVAQAIKKPGCLFNMNEPYPSSEPAAKEPVGKAKKGGPSPKAKQAQQSGLISGGASKQTIGIAATTSGSLAAPASGPAGGGSGVADDDPRDGGSPGPVVPVEAAPEADEPDAGAENSVDPIPWMVGAANPIPEELSQALRVMERIVSQNVFHKQHMIYRNYPTLDELAKLDQMRMDEAGEGGGAGGLPDASQTRRSVGAGGSAEEGGEPAIGAGAGDEDRGDRENGGGAAADEEPVEETEARDEGGATDGSPRLQDLFCFDAPQLTQGMTVTCAEWNRHNEDLLAVSYGDTAPVPNTPGGLVLFWSLKNPTYPERVIRTKSGVTALHFSSVHANMVAAGAHDGSVMIWDLRRGSDTPMLRSGSSVSTHNDQKHTDIVWETRWVDRGPDKQPVMVSVSSDGNVLQWNMKKGLEQTLLMQLKRLPNVHLGSNNVYGYKEGIVFRKSSGFCLDFPRHDTSTYLVGTEDGLVHKCSTSYNEQYLDTYYGHSGPVYRVRCNPFMSHAFLTCSADWTMKLWTTRSVAGHPIDAPLLTFQSQDLSDSVNDVTWAPHNSTCFAAAMDDGRVELWDLSEKPLDPIVVHYPRAHQNKNKRTCVRFSPNSPVLVAGDDQGSVDVMRMYNTNQSYYSDQEQQERLNAVMVKKR